MLKAVPVFSQDLIFLISNKISSAKIVKYRLFWEWSFIYNLFLRSEDLLFFLISEHVNEHVTVRNT